jgi:hypothetical protein
VKATITKQEYLQLVGLLTVAQYHVRHLEELKNAAAAMLGIHPENGSMDTVGDAIYNGQRALELLEKLGLAVEEGELS